MTADTLPRHPCHDRGARGVSLGISGEPASGENPSVEKKPVAAAEAKPFLTSVDSMRC
jgi:hypothetical protein